MLCGLRREHLCSGADIDAVEEKDRRSGLQSYVKFLRSVPILVRSNWYAPEDEDIH